jgi:aspartyl-tRNA(Asn)/glutamyl-tRNA(Gln) amidotransferase subunit C
MPNEIDKTTLEKIVKLAHIKIEGRALDAHRRDLAAILDWMEQLNEVDISGVAPLAHPIELKAVMREDQIEEPIAQEIALGTAAESQSGFFTTPKTNE